MLARGGTFKQHKKQNKHTPTPPSQSCFQAIHHPEPRAPGLQSLTAAPPDRAVILPPPRPHLARIPLRGVWELTRFDPSPSRPAEQHPATSPPAIPARVFWGLEQGESKVEGAAPSHAAEQESDGARWAGFV